MRACGNDDTAITLIALVIASALVIYLFRWTGVVGVALFVIYAWFSPPLKQRTFLGQVVHAGETGCGIIVLFIVVLLLARLCRC